jgi:hypothetical protein
MTETNFYTGYQGFLGTEYKLPNAELTEISQRIATRVNMQNKVRISGVSGDIIQTRFKYTQMRTSRRHIEDSNLEDMKNRVIERVIAQLSDDIVNYYTNILAKKDRSIWDGGRRRFGEDNSMKAISSNPTRSQHTFDEPRF